MILGFPDRKLYPNFEIISSLKRLLKLNHGDIKQKKYNNILGFVIYREDSLDFNQTNETVRWAPDANVWDKIWSIRETFMVIGSEHGRSL